MKFERNTFHVRIALGLGLENIQRTTDRLQARRGKGTYTAEEVEMDCRELVRDAVNVSAFLGNEPVHESPTGEMIPLTSRDIEYRKNNDIEF